MIEIPFYMRMITSGSASIGFDHGSPVSQLYDDLFSFTGKLHELEIQLVAREPRDLAEVQQRAARCPPGASERDHGHARKRGASEAEARDGERNALMS